MSRRSVVLVTIDSLRADHCGFMGYDAETTPTLDKLAADGLVFENAISSGTRTPDALPVMLTGRYPIGHGSGSTLSDHQSIIKNHMRARETLAERFSRKGYATAAFTPNPWTSRHFGFDKGFDHFVDFLDEDRGSYLFERMLNGQGSRRVNAIRLLLSWVQRENTFKPWESFYDRMIDWVHRQSTPFFLWVFLLDPHFPYLANRANRTQSMWSNLHANLQLYLQDQDSPYTQKTRERLMRGYDDAIRYTDQFFDRLHTDLAGDAELVITADHGEGFGEHGTFGHHHELYEENVHVPLLVSGDDWNGSLKRPVSLTSLPAIITSVARSDQTAVEETTEPSVPITPSQYKAGLRGANWKYIQTEGDISDEFYDLGTDPTEQDNRIKDVDVEPFRELLKHHRQHLETEKRLSDKATSTVLYSERGL